VAEERGTHCSPDISIPLYQWSKIERRAPLSWGHFRKTKRTRKRAFNRKYLHKFEIKSIHL